VAYFNILHKICLNHSNYVTGESTPDTTGMKRTFLCKALQ